MTRTPSARSRRIPIVIGLTATLALGLAACGDDDSDSSLSGGSGDGEDASRSLNLAMVPVIDAEPYLYAQEQGYYEDADLDVNFEDVDSGPSVVTGVINGTYDGAASAWFPVYIAMAEGSPLKLLSAVSVEDPDGGTSGLVVSEDSPIEDYADLEGKEVATNALTSLTTLATQIQMDEAGADPEAINFTSLPFKSAVQAVDQDQVDAAVVVSPFQTEAEQDGLTVLDDPIKASIPDGAPGLVLFTNEDNSEDKADAFADFNEATQRAADELEDDPELKRAIAADVVGLDADVADEVPMPGFDTEIDPDLVQEQLDLAEEYGYLDQSLDADDLVSEP